MRNNIPYTIGNRREQRRVEEREGSSRKGKGKKKKGKEEMKSKRHHTRVDSHRKTVEFTMVLQMANFFLSPMQYLPLLAGGGLSHSLSANFKPPPQLLLQPLMGPHLPQPPCTAVGRVPIVTHFLRMHHWIQASSLFFARFVAKCFALYRFWQEILRKI